MPQLSDSMEQGLVLQWLIEDGQPVEIGDELVDIETDKATMTVASEFAGTLTIVVPAGTTVAVGEVIARVGDRATAPAPAEATPEPEPAAVMSNGHGAVAVATPVAKRLASVHGVQLDTVTGTGPRGRITKSDVLTAAGVELAAALPKPRASEPAATPPVPTADRTVELTRTQALIARRMSEAKSTVPHFQVQTEVTMDSALALRGALKALDDGEAVPSINDLIVRACALALRAHPRANGSYRNDHFELHDRVNVGVAVAADDALIVPTVFDADTKGPRQIAAETRRLAERVRTAEITPPELSGATFTVSNLGMFGMTAITPVINPPQAAILGVGAVRQTLARDQSGAIVDRSLLTLTLSCDHRILYGADAARFLADVKAILETPLKLMV